MQSSRQSSNSPQSNPTNDPKGPETPNRPYAGNTPNSQGASTGSVGTGSVSQTVVKRQIKITPTSTSGVEPSVSASTNGDKATDSLSSSATAIQPNGTNASSQTDATATDAKPPQVAIKRQIKIIPATTNQPSGDQNKQEGN